MRRTASILTALALAAGTTAALTAPTATAAPAAKKAKPAITLKVDKTVVEAGKKVTLKGTIKPKKGTKGDKVTIQQRNGDKPWKTQAKVKVNGKGKFTWSDKPTTGTVRKYRAILPKTKKHAKATSKAVTVTAAQWMNLLEVQWAHSARMDSKTTRVNGVDYPRSAQNYFWSGATDASIELNLYRRCYKLKAEVALSDTTVSNSSAKMTLQLDGVTKLTKDVSALGTKLAYNADLTGAYRARLEILSTSGGSDTVAAFLSPQFLCTQAPSA